MDGAPPLTVATIAREPLAVMQRFLHWHLDQGAARIIAYLDDPDDPALPRFTGDPRLDLRPCTPAFWRSLNLQPKTRFTRRQRAALTQAYRETAEGWVMILDADELMWTPGRSLPEALSDLPPETRALRVRTAEQVSLRDGTEAFRLPIPREVVNTIYGADADLFRARFGLVGHPEGKSIYRAGLEGIELKLHWALDTEGNRIDGPVWDKSDGAYLLHYVAPGYDRWRAKMDWRAGAHGFVGPLKTRIEEIARSPNPEAAYRALHDRLHSLDAAEEAALDAAGGLMRAGPPVTAG